MMTRLRFIGIVLAMLVLIFTGTGSGLLNGVVSGGEGKPGDQCQQCTIMKPTLETLQEWVEAYNSAPMAPMPVPRLRAPRPAGSLNLLNHLQYTPAERNQGWCGNCWVWAGTGVMEIALDVQNGVKDRLSIQYLNSNYDEGRGIHWACCGGWLAYLRMFYAFTGKAIPWSNTNAYYQDGGRTCGDGSTSVPADTISTVPYYAITSITEKTIPTLPNQRVDQATAIANIKNILDQNKAVWFAFFLATGDDWDNFIDFWLHKPESAIWNPDFSCGRTADSGIGAHAVLCIGYNDGDGEDNDYWIMLNSWGTAGGGRPSGLFRLDMNMDYGCYYYNPYPSYLYYSFYWQTLDIAYALPSTATNQQAGTLPPTKIVIEPDEATITASESQVYYADAYDADDNWLADVTDLTTFSINADAGGSWGENGYPGVNNVYTSANPGTWTVKGTYEGLTDDATLTVKAPGGVGGGWGWGDVTPPVISGVGNCGGGVTETTADVCWVTNEPSTSQLEWWASPGTLTPLDETLVLQHIVHLTDLTPGTTYHYRAMSKDGAGNLTVSPEYTFTTLGKVPAAAFTTSDLSISPSEVDIGGSVTISAMVTNTGSASGSYEVTLKLNGVTETTEEVTLAAGKSKSVSFTVSKAEVGSYSVDVNGLSGSFTVEEAVHPTALPEVKSPINWPVIGGIIAGVVIVGLIAFFLVRRRAH